MKSALKYLILFTGLFPLFFGGCAEENTGKTPTYGIDTLSSDMETLSGNSYQGFDFSEARIRYEYISSVNQIIDMALLPMVDGLNQGIGGRLWMPSQQPVYYDMGPTPITAIPEAPEEGYIPEVTINPGFCYCIITAEGNYAKIYVMELDYGNRPSGEPYCWIRFNWVYQPDGTRWFGGGD